LFNKLSQNSALRCSRPSDSVLIAQIQTCFDLRRQPLQHILTEQLFISPAEWAGLEVVR
jgi:hypothetical protein